jgi:hypothetical protein
LSQSDADFITQRIFPGEFATVRFDAATCVASSLTDSGAAGAGGEAPTVGTNAGAGGEAPTAGAGGEAGAI